MQVPDCLNVLLIEDETTDIMLMEEYFAQFRRQVFRLYPCNRFEQALEMLSQERCYCMVLLDWYLPDGSGIQNLRRLHKHYPNLPVIVLTGLDDSDTAINAIREEAQDYLIKDEINPNTLEQSIIYGIERKKIKDELLESLEIQARISQNLIEKSQELRTAYELLEAKSQQINNDLEQARITQRAMLPQAVPKLNNAELAVRYVTMEKIGGDFYDFYLLGEGRWGILLVDITGHGTAAALLAGMVSGFFKTFAPTTPNPLRTMMQVNDALLPLMPEGKFATACYSVFDENQSTLEYVFSGHPPGYLIRDGEVRPVHQRGLLLGMLPSERVGFQSKTLALQPKDKVILCTDGIFEVGEPDQKGFGEEAFRQQLQALTDLEIQSLLDRLFHKMQSFAPEQQFEDDITLVGLQIGG